MKSAPSLKEALAADMSNMRSLDNVNELVSEVTELRQQLVDQKEMIQDLERQAMEDPLTELYNRRAFDKKLGESLAYYKRYNRAGAILLIDMDGFKTINDTIGHLAGDALLKHVSKLLRAHTRDSDVVARIGGDEFCIILKEVNSRETMLKAQEICEVISRTPCAFEGRDIYGSVSIGCCCFSQARNRGDLIEKADKAMYMQKSHSTSVGA